MSTDFEKLGVFYLGREYDLAQKAPRESLLLYDSKDLVTHAVCVGMTGSGKTGLCLAVLEEAAIDGIPALVIDPKGDLANLLLTFPQLRPEDFTPWINEDDARKRGLEPAEFAKQQAELWSRGLADWGQDAARIQRLRDAADFAIYTPGSTAGLPVSVLHSFDPPAAEVISDAELLRDRIQGTVGGLLGLLNVSGDPLQSREHILMSSIVETAWREGRKLDLASLVQLVQNPPLTRVGVLDLESFFPAKERFELAMRLNNLLASPGFEVWLQGEPLDVGSLLYTPQGKPRIAIVSIAHLGDAERMFVVTLLLNQTLAWVRSQSGTTSLRALVYMDEIAGYFPPVATPPSKAPLLTLLKQARAFGVGVMLATQNPVDLDYKGLSNAGTWFIGRLQTERDKARVLDGLEGAAANASGGFDRQRMEQALSALGNRVFLMNNVHDDAPVVFQTRWAMSYLRGPLTRDQIRKLMHDRKAAAAPVAATQAAAASVAATGGAPGAGPVAAVAASAVAVGGALLGAASQRPVLGPDVPQYFVPVRKPRTEGTKLVYQPALLGLGRVYFSDAKLGVDATRKVAGCLPLGAENSLVDWQQMQAVELSADDLETAPAEGAEYAALSTDASKAKSYKTWSKGLADTLYRDQRIELWRSAALEQVSKIDEAERDFRIRLQQAAREERDALKEKLTQKFAPKLAALQEKVRKAELTIEKEKAEQSQQKMQSWLSAGATVLGAVLGRKKLSVTNITRAGSALRQTGRASKEARDVQTAEERFTAAQEELAALDQQYQAEVAALDSKIDPLTESLETVVVKPKKTNVNVDLTALVWLPAWQTPGGAPQPAWQ